MADDQFLLSSSDDSDDVNHVADQHSHSSRSNRAVFTSFVESINAGNIVSETSTVADQYRGNSHKIIDRARAYQQELFEKAKDENIIAVLDTGSGKTLIACLLIRDVLAQELIRRGKGNAPKIVVFMANSVHLVRQQAEVLEHNLATLPIVFCGDDKHDWSTRRQEWGDTLKKNTPIVCTPEILQQCLDGAVISMDKISLLIFDEAHHAKKNHPYCRIIRSHYLNCPSNHRPKIFAMTASPVDSKGRIDTKAADLEHLLQSKIVTTSDLSIMSFTPKPIDVIWEYGKPQVSGETELHTRLWPLCHFYDDLKRAFEFSRMAQRELGPWCADRVWYFAFRLFSAASADVVRRYEQSKSFAEVRTLKERKSHLDMLRQASQIVYDHYLATPKPERTDLSAKVACLHDKLMEIYRSNPRTRAMVFVDQRMTAMVLNECFRCVEIPHLYSGVLLGSRSNSPFPRDEVCTLERFRNGTINLMFVTSVGDEGIDVPQCNLCVRFDLYNSPIQYMQSRGRARLEGATYIHMVEQENAFHRATVQYAIDSDLYIRQFCQSLPEDRLLGRGTRLEVMVAQDSKSRRFKTTSGTICDFGNSLLILSRFSSSLKHLGAQNREIYEEEIDCDKSQFRYIVKLPGNIDIVTKGARGEWRPNKQLAKRSAAFNCCYLLRSRGMLDESLDSLFKKQKPDNLNAQLAVTDKKGSYPMLLKPSRWKQGFGSIPTALYASIVKFEPEKPLRRSLSAIVLFTRERLPDFPDFNIYVEENVCALVKVQPFANPLDVSHQEVQELTDFTLVGVFSDVFNKVYERDIAKISYWLAPANSMIKNFPFCLADIVNLAHLSEISKGRVKWTKTEFFERDWTNRFLCDPWSGRFHYFTGTAASDVSVLDPVPTWVPDIKQKARTNIIDFSDSRWKASKKKSATAYWDVVQPVLNAEMVMTRRNFLEPASEHECQRKKCLVAPQPLEVSRLSPDFAASCLIWPSIIHRLEAYMIASEAFCTLGLHAVPIELALEAFTKDSDVSDAQRQIHSSEKHGMGKNYERLEFIGDSFLKMMTTITVFLRTKCNEEGMHCRRMEILCNRRLFNVSTEKYQLFKYARTSAFNRLTWYPEGLVLVKGRGAKEAPETVEHSERTHQLGMKTIADISEAIIGAAAVATRSLPLRFDLGIKAISALVDSPDHAIQSWLDLSKMYIAPEWSLRMDDAIANDLANTVAMKTGYHFRYPRLLRSAFTHPSDINATVPDLQRLEFLGDAVLDWVSISWLFDSNPDRNPQWLTEHKMAMVSNKFLAALAVVLDFDKLIQINSVALMANISAYAQKVRASLTLSKARSQSGEATQNRNFWTEITSPPKALSDLVESYIGAVLIDSDFRYEEIEKFFNNHVQWFFEDISRYDGFANRHPTSHLHKKVQNEYKCRNFQVLTSEPAAGHIENVITAGVLVHNQVIAHSQGSSVRQAKVEASKLALKLFEDLTKADFILRFGCDCEGDAKKERDPVIA